MTDTITLYSGSGIGQSTDNQNKGYNVTYQIRRATVQYITLNPDDDDYSAENVGLIRYRYLGDNAQLDTLKKAKPINSAIKIYPVKYEIVLIIKFGEDSYYFPPLNRSGFINNNSSLGLTDSNSKDVNYNDMSLPKSSIESEFNMGEYFSSNKLLPVLMPYEGDVIIQGRFGNGIRLGNNPLDGTNTPNIKIGNLLVDDVSEFESVDENLDDDNCIWITTDETLIFEEKSIPINGDGNTKIKSTTEDDWKGRQISIFSDRIILQSKENEIVGYSNLGIHWSCNKNFSIDSDDEVIINSKNDIKMLTNNELIINSKYETRINSLKTMIGKLDANEPLVCGNLWKDMMEELLDILIKHTHPTGTGPSGPPIEMSDFERIRNNLDNQLSDDNFTTKTNK